jgi:hypothetical protein
MTEPNGLGARPARMVRRFLALTFLVMLLTVAAPVTQVLACSCAQTTPDEALNNARFAFVGVVAAIDDPSIGPLVGTGDPLQYTFAVEQTLKGELGERIRVFSAREGASCGQEFALAQRWRVYAYVDEEGRLGSGLCSGNELLAEGAPIPPASPTPLTLPPVAVLVALGVALVVAGFSVWAFTRQPGPTVR